MTEITVKDYKIGGTKVLISGQKKIFINHDYVDVIVLHPLFKAEDPVPGENYFRQICVGSQLIIRECDEEDLTKTDTFTQTFLNPSFSFKEGENDEFHFKNKFCFTRFQELNVDEFSLLIGESWLVPDLVRACDVEGQELFQNGNDMVINRILENSIAILLNSIPSDLFSFMDCSIFGRLNAKLNKSKD